jgi:hypothetical protein
VKIALALSVNDGKGEQSWCANQPTSEEGSRVRSKWAAWLSGPEKSRHLRQLAAAPGLGFEAIIASRLGRDESGIGGGAPVFRFGVDSEVTADGRFVGTGGTRSLLLKPISSADRRGGGAITLFARSFEACLWGNDGGSRVDCLGGNEGLAGRSTHHFSVTFSKSTSFECCLGLTIFLGNSSTKFKQARTIQAYITHLVSI